MPPPKVSGPPKPASSMRTTSTFGAPSGAFGPGMIDQSATDSSIVRPIAPPKARSGIGSTVRSGLNLPIASASASFSPLRPLLVHLDDRLGRRAGERLLGGQAVLLVDHGDDGGRARLELLAEAALETAVDLVLGELADDAAGGGADGGRRRAAAAPPGRRGRRRRRPSRRPCGRGGRRCAVTWTSPSSSCVDEDHALGLDLLVLDELHQLVEVLLGRLERRVAGQDEVVGVSHDPSLMRVRAHVCPWRSTMPQ